jgi:hypothetical protein
MLRTLQPVHVCCTAHWFTLPRLCIVGGQALTPLTIGRSSARASLLGALWGFGHSTGQLILGILLVVRAAISGHCGRARQGRVCPEHPAPGAVLYTWHSIVALAAA